MSFTLPTLDDCFQHLIALHPRGRAFQTNDVITTPQGESIFREFWYGVATVWCDFEAKMLQMLADFNCATTGDDADLWAADYEDECGLASFNLCLKVQESAGGDTQNIAFYNNIAVTMGYSATFEWLKGDHTAYPGKYSALLVTVDSANSPAFSGVIVGEAVVGEAVLGGVGVELLECILQKIVPAHIELIFVVV